MVTHGNGQVNLVSAVAASGFSVQLEETGPERVRVVFESDSHESEFDAKYENGQYTVEQDEEPTDDD